jgi:hypothetical protein
VKRLVACLAAALMVATACARPVDGKPQPGPRQVDPGFFFVGETPVYGQTVSNSDAIMLSYLRAMRRVDVCGLVDHATMAKIGEIGSVGTLFALDECDFDLKVPGQTDRKFLSVQLTLARTDQPAAFRTDGLPVYETFPGSCEYLLPLDMSGLPGATRLRKPDQPYLRIGLIAEDNCGFVRRVVEALAQRIGPGQLPGRDAVAVYPAVLAERDPCEVLSVLAGDVDHWDISRSRPYECEFAVFRDGYPDVVSLQLALEPQIVENVVETRERRDQDGAVVYLNSTFCSAVTFVGDPMQRKRVSGDFVPLQDLEIRPAVVVESGGENCDAVVDVAGIAAKLYG